MSICEESRIVSFFTELRKSNIADGKYRKRLVDIFANETYLNVREDTLTIFFNLSEAEPVEITQVLRDSIKAQLEHGSSSKTMVPRRGIACIASQSMVTSLCSDLNAARSTLSDSIPAQ